MCKVIKNLSQISIFLFLSTLLVSLAQASPWPASAFNPKANSDDVLLPMPCAGKMTFRKVLLPVQKPLDDLPILLGSTEQDWGVLEGTSEAHIGGSFTDSPAGSGRYYLIGKYEVSLLQYDAVMNEKCLDPVVKNRVPKTGLSWFDAIQFGDRYSQWLQKNALSELPHEDGAPGFVRLPTEVEWSFAARGGVAVTPTEFQQSRFPMSQALSNYAWYAGPQSSNGKIRPTGLLDPNPLGLHDVLGNADEMIFEPFRLRTHGRSHGQAGGFVVRGANYLTPGADIRTSWRVEQPYYREGQQNRIVTTGFRVVLVAPAITSTKRMEQLQKEWISRGQSSEQKAVDASTRLDRLAAQSQGTAIEAELRSVRDQLRAANQLQQEQRDRAMRSSIQSGAFLCAELNQSGRRVRDLDNWLDKECKASQSANQERTCENIRMSREKFKQALDTVLGLYSDSIVELGSIYPVNDLNAQAQVVRQMLTARRSNNLDRYVDTYATSLREYITDRKIQKPTWLANCVAVVP